MDGIPGFCIIFTLVDRVGMVRDDFDVVQRRNIVGCGERDQWTRTANGFWSAMHLAKLNERRKSDDHP